MQVVFVHGSNCAPRIDCAYLSLSMYYPWCNVDVTTMCSIFWSWRCRPRPSFLPWVLRKIQSVLVRLIRPYYYHFSSLAQLLSKMYFAQLNPNSLHLALQTSSFFYLRRPRSHVLIFFVPFRRFQENFAFETNVSAVFTLKTNPERATEVFAYCHS